MPKVHDPGPDTGKMLAELRVKPESEFLEAGAAKALNQFQEMAARVPAYAKYLATQKFDPKSVRAPKDLASVPAIDKAGYLRQYDRAELCWDGDLAGKSWVISTTSGSTGEPFYFPRQAEQDAQYALTAELYLRSNFKIHERSTLYIVAFPMGAWIGGVFTYEALRRVAENGPYALSIITPGISKIEVIKAVKNLGRDFDQIIIGSYAPFLKDIIDDGVRAGIDWPSYNLGFVFSAEGFSEKFRDYVAAKTGLSNIYTDTLNHYGTVDLGTMAHETPVCILIRRLALEKPELYEAIFGQTTKLPTLCQYHPEHFYFEENEGDLYCTAPSGLPLVRYDLKDRGGVVTLARMEQIFSDHGLNLRAEVAQAGLADTLWNLPFVYVYERSDFSVSFFAFQVYPETVRNALTHGEFPEQLTGKFTMTVGYDSEGQQELTIHLEFKPETSETPELSDKVKAAIVTRLIQENSEYRRTHEEYGERVHPKLVFWPYEDLTYFRPGTKQKWVQK
jgi:phenylacetate-CoA ligase